MMKEINNLSEKIWKKILPIIDITIAIDYLRKQQFFMEISNRTNTREYEKIWKEADAALSFEEAYYKPLSFTTNDFITVFKFFNDFYGTPKDEKGRCSLLQILLNKDNDRIIKRIIFNLFSNFLVQTNELDYDNESALIQLMPMFDLPELWENANSARLNTLIQLKLEKALMDEKRMYMLLFIENATKKAKNKEFKKQLIKDTHDIRFVAGDIEKLLYCDKTALLEFQNIDLKIIQALFKIKKRVYKRMKREHGDIITTSAIRHLLEWNDRSYEDDTVIYNSILKLCELQSGLRLLDEKTLLGVEETFYRIKDEICSSYFSFKISEDIILQAVVSAKWKKNKDKYINPYTLLPKRKI